MAKDALEEAIIHGQHKLLAKGTDVGRTFAANCFIRAIFWQAQYASKWLIPHGAMESNFSACRWHGDCTSEDPQTDDFLSYLPLPSPSSGVRGGGVAITGLVTDVVPCEE